MEKNYDAIIIGSGIGGAAIGALLSYGGWKVLILDKNKMVGGRCITYQKDGFKVDLGVHLFGVGNKGSLGEVCRRVQIPDLIDWITIKNPTLRVKDTTKKYSRKAMMEMLPENEKENLNKLFAKVFELSDEEIEQLWYVPLEDWVEEFTSNKLAHALIQMINGQYFCVNLNEASTAEFIKCFREVVKARSSAYPRGGCISIPKAYLSVVEKNGGEIKTGAEVTKVIVENKEARGVILKDGSKYFAPVVISNADIKKTVNNLVGEEHFPKEYVQRINELTYAQYAPCLKVALKEKITDDQLMMYIPDEFTQTIKVSQALSNGVLPELVGGMITSPTNYDPSLAPPGRQLIFFGGILPFSEDWKKWEDVMINSFYTVYPQAKGKVLWYRFDNPDLVDAYAGEQGNIIGIGQTVNQIHERRPSVVSPLKGLYYSSAEAGGHGIGTELAADSALELFNVLVE